MATDAGESMRAEIDEMTTAGREAYRKELKKAGLRLWRVTGMTGAKYEEYAPLIQGAQSELLPHEHPLIAMQWTGPDDYTRARTGTQTYTAEIWCYERLLVPGLRRERQIKVERNGGVERLTLSYRGLRGDATAIKAGFVMGVGGKMAGKINAETTAWECEVRMCDLLGIEREMIHMYAH